ncbi:MAG TPA: HDOD domain-containing protein [Gammaproteobacteria bacterium]|nr:HDOD domain-containing protein [Gammaproteobacteria bacterium]
MAEILIGRQPIYTPDLGVYAYELMSPPTSESTLADADKAASQVIINAFMEIGIDKLVGKQVAFITLSEHLLQNDCELSLPTEQVILKIPSHIKPSEEAINATRRLAAAGFKLALDNHLQHPNLQPFSAMASIIDINIETLNETEINAHLKILKKLHPIILAAHVNTHEQYEICRSTGVNYIQGYFLNRPHIVRGESLDSNQMSIINLLSTLHNEETDTDTITEVISRDVGLSYKILQLMNSAFFSRSTKIESIQHATVMLGRKQLCTWASLMALSSMDNKPREQVRISMVRARSCEQLAEKAGLKHTDSFFTVGMFSSLDLLMDRSLEDLISPLPLADNISTALLNREGELGDALNCTLAQEEGDWINICFAELTQEELSDINIEAINWAEDVMNNI